MKRTSLVLFALMILSALSAHALIPTTKLAEQNGKPHLEKIVPNAFGPWMLDPHQVVAVVNPVQEENIKRVYDQTLSRTYLRSDGYRIMLSIAYGADQRSGEALGVHYPEVCYPAQGFEVLTNTKGALVAGQTTVPVRRLETKLGTQRREPVTYWTTLGEYLTLGGLDRRLIELRYGLKGEIPDGLLFRVSSIDSNSQRAFEIQESFIKELLQQLPDKPRAQLVGSGA